MLIISTKECKGATDKIFIYIWWITIGVTGNQFPYLRYIFYRRMYACMYIDNPYHANSSQAPQAGCHIKVHKLSFKYKFPHGMSRSRFRQLIPVPPIPYRSRPNPIQNYAIKLAYVPEEFLETLVNRPSTTVDYTETAAKIT